MRHTTGGQTVLDTATLLGPNASQGATTGTPRGDQTAWETDDDGGESDLHLGASLFPVSVAPGEHVVVTLTFRESDGDNYADVETQAASAAGAALAVVTAAFPAAAVVTAPVGLALAAVTAVGQALKSFLTNTDDLIGTMTIALTGTATGIDVVQVGASGTISPLPADGSPAVATVRLTGDGCDYEVTIGLPDTVMQQNPTRVLPWHAWHRLSSEVITMGPQVAMPHSGPLTTAVAHSKVTSVVPVGS